MSENLLELVAKGIRHPRRVPSHLIKQLPGGRRILSIPYLLKHKHKFQQIEKYCLFIGHGRTGHSLVGALLNAHRNAVVSHELNSLEFLRSAHIPITKNQLFALTLHRDAEFESVGREWTKYQYNINTGWQGSYDSLRVIGDKKGGSSSRILGKNPELLDELRNTIDIPVRVIHVVRNPFDTFASRIKISEEWRESGIDRYFSNAKNVDIITNHLSADEFYRIRYEDFVKKTNKNLADLCRFLDLDPDEEYINTCADFVFDSPKQTRHEIEMSDELIDRIQKQKENHKWLSDYNFNA
jgi:hypothetical protein